MDVKIQQFLFGQLHSWSLIGQSIAHELLKLNHSVDLISTDGVKEKYLDPSLKQYLVNQPKPAYDICLSYTFCHNWPAYLKGGKNRFAIWCYEWPILPAGSPKYHQFVDKILAPTQFAKESFINSKIPENKIVVIPHGITLGDFNNKNKYTLKTKKNTIIYVNAAQNHLRKNLPGMFVAYGKAFTNQDDVCLVAKIHQKQIKAAFDIDINKVLKEFKKQYPKHAEIELITEYVPNIIELYNACDIVYTLSYCEGSYMPGIEALALNKLNVAPRYGGQLDFLNDENSLLVEGKITRADMKEQYWAPNILNTHFESDLDDASNKLKTAVAKHEELRKKIQFNIDEWSWATQVNKILNLCKE